MSGVLRVLLLVLGLAVGASAAAGMTVVVLLRRALGASPRRERRRAEYARAV